MYRREVKLHIINVLHVLIDFANQFKLDDIATELIACTKRLDSTAYRNKVMREEVIRYHTEEVEE